MRDNESGILTVSDLSQSNGIHKKIAIRKFHGPLSNCNEFNNSTHEAL